MVDKIIIPQTEQIAYLDNITPSYEEFMKTYKSDDKVNASYENEINSYGDLGIEKGYGPCRRHCGYNNSGCTYYLPDFAPLYMCCPACDNKDVTLWVHSGCNGPMYISEYLRLECKECYTGGHWREWEFLCSKHKGYRSASSPFSFQTAVRMGLGLQIGNSDLRDLVKRISKKLIDECQ